MDPKKTKLPLAICILALLGAAGIFLLSAQERTLSVTFLDVGQGDSILIETPSGQTVLIDGGPDRSVLAELGRALPLYERKIDLLVLTHGDADHVTGQVEVLRRYDVRHILYTGVQKDSAVYREWLDEVEQEHTETTTAQAGQTFVFGEATLTVVFPFTDLEGQKVEPVNDSSIFLKLEYGESEFLFTGDASSEVEKRILEHGSDIDVDVLKVGHHGSKTSTSAEFLKAATPDIAVIQVGKDNRFGHPTPETLGRLEDAGAKVLRTDEQRRIEVVSDGEMVWVKQP